MAAPFTVTSSVDTLQYKEPRSYSLVAVMVKEHSITKGSVNCI
jgi:hypothetical protein